MPLALSINLRLKCVFTNMARVFSLSIIPSVFPFSPAPFFLLYWHYPLSPIGAAQSYVQLDKDGVRIKGVLKKMLRVEYARGYCSDWQVLFTGS